MSMANVIILGAIGWSLLAWLLVLLVVLAIAKMFVVGPKGFEAWAVRRTDRFRRAVRERRKLWAVRRQAKSKRPVWVDHVRKPGAVLTNRLKEAIKSQKSSPPVNASQPAEGEVK